MKLQFVHALGRFAKSNGCMHLVRPRSLYIYGVHGKSASAGLRGMKLSIRRGFVKHQGNPVLFVGVHASRSGLFGNFRL